MPYRCSNVEIDEDRRELRGAAAVIEPQRRVFDLLLYLARHGSRVVPKNELLEAVWPGVLVTDNSLQRAVSLARRALRQAGGTADIRTHVRQGYRLCAGGSAEPEDPLQRHAVLRAAEAFARGDYDTAMDVLRTLDNPAALSADDLRFWFHVAQCAGRSTEAAAALELAASAPPEAARPDRAACAAILLAQLRLDGREPALARGWIRRATRLLDTIPENREHGHVSFARCRLALFENDLDAAVRFADAAREVGERCGDADLQCLGLLYGGEARLYRGEIEAGLAAIDEAGAAVVALKLSAWAGGLVYCGIIFSSLTRADWHRAAQWNDQFTRWCELNRAPGALGLCRLHRAESLCVQGRLAEAECEARLAQDTLARTAPWAEGDAWRVLGEIQLARGDWAKARASFTRTQELGWHAQLGLSLLEHAEGNTEQACRLLARAARDPHWSNRARRGFLLAHLAAMCARAGHLHEAHEALAELENHPELISSSALEALALAARAEVSAGDGHGSRAIDLLQVAIRRWQAVEAPLIAAQTRCRLAELLAAEGDELSAQTEFVTARAVFRHCGALGLLSACERARRRRDRTATLGPAKRGRQVRAHPAGSRPAAPLQKS